MSAATTGWRATAAGGQFAVASPVRRVPTWSEKLSLEGYEVHPLYRGAAFLSVRVNGANHDALPAGFAQNFRDPAFIAHQGAARRLAFEFCATRQSGHF